MPELAARHTGQATGYESGQDTGERRAKWGETAPNAGAGAPVAITTRKSDEEPTVRWPRLL